MKRTLLLVIALAVAGCGSPKDNGDQALREQELVLKTKELALQKRSIELREQELKQSQQNQEQMQAANRPAASGEMLPRATSAPIAEIMHHGPPEAAAAGAPAQDTPQQAAQKQLDQLQDILNQLKGQPGAPVEPGAFNLTESQIQPSETWTAPANTNATTQNAQSPEMQKMFDDLRRRSGSR